MGVFQCDKSKHFILTEFCLYHFKLHINKTEAIAVRFAMNDATGSVCACESFWLMQEGISWWETWMKVFN